MYILSVAQASSGLPWYLGAGAFILCLLAVVALIAAIMFLVMRPSITVLLLGVASFFGFAAAAILAGNPWLLLWWGLSAILVVGGLVAHLKD